MRSPSPLRALLLVAGFAAAAGLVVALVWAARPHPPAPAPADAGAATEAGEIRATQPGSRGRAAGPVEPVVEEAPAPPEEDLEAMVPDDAGLREIRQWDFEMQGGASTPGADPAAARREVNEPGWAGRFEGELGRGLEELVLAHGVEAHRISCEHGRCLVELRYDSMITAMERVEAIRRWLRERVPCRAYTDGPLEEDSPSSRPDQQIWILCGEPEPDGGQ